ncbi:PQQ-dependent sugar dehydrogenase [Fulvivirgaceae bacterium PWU5]|uniref:PQQ-dependent sugar dehydrogenase n=1 Tax=Dawidia cretensis TaxID=2782350 RepID=A0AAP2GP35_9BACT|nr:PQQ-dependent sugar dehydrogenase [Dawidia cretensis]MBT1707909.1 PQQ-dependent sugar dehydrogenase [Dawidia cretensis]
MNQLRRPFQTSLAALAWTSIFIGTFLIACDQDDDDDVPGREGRTFVDNLDTPWELAFAPDGRLFFTERPGTITVVEGGEKKAWLKLDSVVQEVGESGLLGLTLDPDFATNRYVYFGYTYAASKGPLQLVNKLVRYREDAATKQPVFDKVLLDGIPGNYIHNSGGLEFGPDGMLYWGMGERYEPALAQDLSQLVGKILRLTRDGAVPQDNPFEGSYVFSYGHRNPQGLAFQPQTGDLWSTEHGPSDEQGCCQDEINRVLPGRNYGWPVIRGSQQQAGMETPVYHSGDTTTWAPTGGIFIKQGDWKDSFVFTGLRGQALYRAVFDPNDPTKIASVERYLYTTLGRLRNVAEGPDGELYIAISNQDGRGDILSLDDRIVIYSQDELEAARD